MKSLKKTIGILLLFVLVFSLTACQMNPSETQPTASPIQSEETVPAESEEPTESEVVAENTDVLKIAALKGPTAMGLIQLIEDSEAEDASPYEFTLAGSADEITPKLIKGEIDLACVPANLAATLYAKTEGAIEVLAINTLGVLYIVENGDSVNSLEDLAGKTVVASGKGSTPEYVLRFLLSENGIDPAEDLTLDWKSEHSECVSALAAGQATVALLPQPFVTVAQNKIEGLRIALDLTEEWDKLQLDSTLITGVLIARKEVVEARAQSLDTFMEKYNDSVEWVNANTAQAAELIGKHDIVDAAIAEKALPYCNIVCITGSEMKNLLSGYLQVLFDSNPTTVGGTMPEEDFYYAN